jgi:predicted transcriptional regulator
MRTNVRENSLKSYDAIHADGTAITQAGRVLAYIRRHPGCSRNDIAEGTGIRLASVCGRVKEMLEDKRPPIIERGNKVDPVTRMSVAKLEAVPTQNTLQLVVE